MEEGKDRQIQDKTDKNKVQPTSIIYVGNTSPTNLNCLEGQHPITRQAFLYVPEKCVFEMQCAS